MLASASTALSLLPFFQRGATNKQDLHSLLLSSPSRSLLLTFSSLTLLSPLPQPLVTLLTSAPVPLLLPMQTLKRHLKAALSAWQRPANFTFSTNIAYLTPLLADLLSLSPSTASSAPHALTPWNDAWTQQPPPTTTASEQLQRVSQYAAEQLRLYEAAHAISADFSAIAQQQLQQVNAFNLRFVPLLPPSPFRFSLDKAVEASFPLMRLPTNHRVHICGTHAEAERAIDALLASLPAQQPMVGFDTESRPMFVAGQPNRPTSLVQLSSLSVSVLCRVRRETGLPPALVRLLLDPRVRKVGQGIGGDVRLLHAQYGDTHRTADDALPDTLLSSPDSHALVDLESLSSAYSIHRVGLAALTGAFLSLRLSKAAQLSNWERHTLTSEQISYAALDSLVSLKLAQRLLRVGDDMQAVVSGWVARERARGGGAEVEEAKVWRWLTGKGLSGMLKERDENEGEAEAGKKRTERDKRRKVQQSAPRNPLPPVHTDNILPRKPRHRAVNRRGSASGGNGSAGARASASAPTIVSAL